MYATTFLLTGITLLQPGEGPYMDPLVKTKFVPFLSTNLEYKLSLGREVFVSLFGSSDFSVGQKVCHDFSHR